MVALCVPLQKVAFAILKSHCISRCMDRSMSKTRQVREQGLDKFYTKRPVAQRCIECVGSRYDWASWDLVLEPSAGSGSFFEQIPAPNKVGIDVRPECDGVVEQDFFDYRPPTSSQGGRVLVLGNPLSGGSVLLRFGSSITPQRLQASSPLSSLEPFGASASKTSSNAASILSTTRM